MRDELRSILPRGALLCVDFIGESVLELLIDARFKEVIITAVTALGYPQLPLKDALSDMIKKAGPGGDSGKKRRNAKMCIHRANRIASRHKNPTVKHYYRNLVDRATEELSRLPPETSNHAPPPPTAQSDITRTTMRNQDEEIPAITMGAVLNDYGALTAYSADVVGGT